MYASFTPSGSYAVELSDSTNVAEDLFNLRDNSGRDIQQRKNFRSASGLTYDRGNQFTDITASVLKQFAKLEDGTDWLRAMRDALLCVGLTSPNGTVTLYARNFDGSTKSFTIANANVTVTLVEQIGSSFEFSYHIQGGA